MEVEHVANSVESSGLERTETAVNEPSKAWSPALPLSVLACVVGSLIGMVIVHGIEPLFAYADLPELGIAPKPELVQQHLAATYDFWSKNFAVDFAIIGLCLGAALGCVADRARRANSMVLGAILGAIGGAVASYIVGRFIAEAIIQSADQSLVQSTIFHFAVWSAMLAPALGVIGYLHRGIAAAPSFALGGVGLGVLVAVVHNLVFSVAFSKANLLMIMPASLTERIVWAVVCGSVVGLGLSLGSRPRNAVRA